ncbi:hypothetical protein ACM66T_10060 [Sulfurimonas sp. ST-25]|uniref:hypothetical protein n=1 Tax=Sulfurimonas sp. ST-25 TaxID=3400151 RepID=UPI003A871D34
MNIVASIIQKRTELLLERLEEKAASLSEISTEGITAIVSATKDDRSKAALKEILAIKTELEVLIMLGKVMS